MKLHHNQLSKHLSDTKLAPIYFISGDETLLVEECAQSIIKSAALQGFTNTVRFSADTSFSWDSFLQATQNLSLLARKTCVLLRIKSWKFDTNAKKHLQHYVEHTNDYHIVIVAGPKLEHATSKTKWFQGLEKPGFHITTWPIELNQLPSWIITRAKTAGLTLTNPQAKMIAELTEGNLLAASQEIEKLCLLGDKVTQNDIESVVSDSTQFDIFKLVDECLLGDGKRCYQILQRLAQQNIEPILIQWALARELRTLYQVLDQMEKGVGFSLLAKKFAIWEKRQAIVKSFLKRHTKEFCVQQLQTLAKVDQQIKGVLADDPWQTLQMICQDIASTKSEIHYA